MSMKAIVNEYTFQSGWAPIAVAATKTGAAIDLANVTANLFLFEFGLWTDGTHTPSLTYSGTAGGAGTYTAVAAADLIGTLTAVNSTTLASAAAGVQKCSYIGPYRYIKQLVTVAGATVGAVIGAHALTRPRLQNAST